jgi:hypothetical protein
MFVQVRKPNLKTTGRSGWCLVFARKMFNIPAKYPTAWKGWLNAKRRYAVTPHPKNVSVPIWFSFVRGRTNFGHVVIYVPKKGYYSSPYKRFSFRAVLPSIKEVERIYSAKYVGWSEDINGVSVVKKVSAPKPAPKPKRKSNTTIAKEVIAGKWGNGPTRIAKLKKAGYNPNTVQTIVNRLIRVR